MAILHAARGLLFVALVIPLASGCTTMRPIGRSVNPGEPSPGVWTVQPGDEVRVTLRDGRRVRVTVQAVDDRGIVATNRARYETTDILLLERKSFSGLKTGILIAAGIVLTWLILAVITLGGTIAGLGG